MKLTRKEIEQAKNITLDQEIKFEEDSFKNYSSIISVNKVMIHLKANYVSGLVLISLKIDADLTLASSRTLNPVPYKMKEEEDLTLAFEQNELTENSEDVIILENDEFDVTNEVYSIIVTSIPLKIVGENEPENIKGDNWELLSEEEYYKRKLKATDPRFEKLKDLDL